MERKDLLKANGKIFVAQGKSLDQYAKKTVKVGLIENLSPKDLNHTSPKVL